MDLVVSGSRHLTDFQVLNHALIVATWRWDWTKLKLHLGGAKGADKLAEQWCDKWFIRYALYKADWNQHGKGAGPIRNREMLDGAGPAARVVAFWDGRKEGCGTWDMIQESRRRKLKLKIIKVEL